MHGVHGSESWRIALYYVRPLQAHEFSFSQRVIRKSVVSHFKFKDSEDSVFNRYDWYSGTVCHLVTETSYLWWTHESSFSVSSSHMNMETAVRSKKIWALKLEKMNNFQNICHIEVSLLFRISVSVPKICCVYMWHGVCSKRKNMTSVLC